MCAHKHTHLDHFGILSWYSDLAESQNMLCPSEKNHISKVKENSLKYRGITESKEKPEISAKSPSQGTIPKLCELAPKCVLCLLILPSNAVLIDITSLKWNKNWCQTQMPSQKRRVHLAGEHVLDVSHIEWVLEPHGKDGIL